MTRGRMDRTEKERVVAELAEQLRSVESLIVADYRGLTNTQLEELRREPPPHRAPPTAVQRPLTQLIGLLPAPLRDLVGLIDARTAQLEEGGTDAPAESASTDPATEPQASADVEVPEEAHDEELISPQPEAADGDADEVGEE